jgi:hypothetical protein
VGRLYARLYGLPRDELRYAARLSASIRKKSTARTLTCTGTQVQVSTRLRAGFPGETFRVLKEKEIKQFGDALRRTRRVVLDALDKM